ncbi:peroxiredoxin [Candidatus Heimdallarchaeota archaeon]|nr:MAG: peroxiredoxin [Candidatus Heimdallarchaeota archaeon]
MLEVGSKAPHFCLLDENRAEVCLDQFKGKWVVLYFYPKDQTPGCTREACDFTLIHNSFDSLNAVVIGVSADSPESHTKFKQKQSLTITLLSDEKLDIIEKYQAKNTSLLGKMMPVKRITYIIDPDGQIAHYWEKVNVIGHSSEVKNTLVELQKSGET